jgi:hypothetical protein
MSNQAELISKDIIDLQDIEKIQYLKTIQADPSRYQQIVADKTTRIQSELVDTKRAAFTKVSGDMARFMDMDNNSRATQTRTSQLAQSQDHIYTEQGRSLATKKTTEDLTRRQVEINEWYYENKRETLFVLQLILLTALTVVVMLAMKTYGWIGPTAADFVTLFVLVVAAGTWVYRWYYTTYIRDRRYWNARMFKAGDIPQPPPKCDPASGTS